jgi:hypothetical protein
MFSNEAGEEKIKALDHPERYFYQRVDVSNKDQLTSACDALMKVIPKGSLFGAVHCAAVNPTQAPTHRMVDKIEVCSLFHLT